MFTLLGVPICNGTPNIRNKKNVELFVIKLINKIWGSIFLETDR